MNFVYICKQKQEKKGTTMATMTLPRQLIVTVDNDVNIGNVTRAIRMLRGVTSIKLAKRTAAEKPRLYDPETGKYLNNSTMKAIEDARKGKGIAFTGSFEEFKKWADEI